MTIGEIIERLEEARDLLGEGAEVRIATGLSWPFENTIQDLHIVKTDVDDPSYCDEDIGVVYIEEGSQIGYLPEQVKEQIGWGS
tara:strand:+ start:582 stop:833 length:252 start_codon:yes stop_codon:yes gene_type:complete